jgi:hypothetical protein
LLANGCGGTTLEDLKEPTVWWLHTRKSCARTQAVDGAATVWLDQGCGEGREFGLERVGTMSDALHKDLLAMFEALQGPVVMPPCTTMSRHVFGRQRSSDGQVVWAACGEATGLGDPQGLTDPFLRIAQAFIEAMNPPP